MTMINPESLEKLKRKIEQKIECLPVAITVNPIEWEEFGYSFHFSYLRLQFDISLPSPIVEAMVDVQNPVSDELIRKLCLGLWDDLGRKFLG